MTRWERDYLRTLGELRGKDADLERLTADCAAYRKALEPFAAWGAKIRGLNFLGDDCPLIAEPEEERQVGDVTVGHLRQAVAALAPDPGSALLAEHAAELARAVAAERAANLKSAQGISGDADVAIKALRQRAEAAEAARYDTDAKCNRLLVELATAEAALKSVKNAYRELADAVVPESERMGCGEVVDIVREWRLSTEAAEAALAAITKRADDAEHDRVGWKAIVGKRDEELAGVRKQIAEQAAELAAEKERADSNWESLERIKGKFSDSHNECKALRRQFLTDANPVTVCPKCNGTADNCCSIGHARVCVCLLCRWRRRGYDLESQLAAANKQIAEHARDTERLDWLISHYSEIDVYTFEGEVCLIAKPSYPTSIKYGDLREAIDAAMAEKNDGQADTPEPATCPTCPHPPHIGQCLSDGMDTNTVFCSCQGAPERQP